MLGVSVSPRAGSGGEGCVVAVVNSCWATRRRLGRGVAGNGSCKVALLCAEQGATVATTGRAEGRHAGRGIAPGIGCWAEGRHAGRGIALGLAGGGW